MFLETTDFSRCVVHDYGLDLDDNNRELLNLFDNGLSGLKNIQDTMEFVDDRSLENDIYLMKDHKMSFKDTISSSRDGNLRDTLYYCNEYFDLMMSDTLDEDIVSNDSQGIIFSIALDKRNYNVSIHFIEKVANNYDKINFHDDKIKSIIEDILWELHEKTGHYYIIKDWEYVIPSIIGL